MTAFLSFSKAMEVNYAQDKEMNKNKRSSLKPQESEERTSIDAKIFVPTKFFSFTH